MSKNMAKHIVKLELEKKLKIEENLINKIMEYHGDIDEMLPEQYFPFINMTIFLLGYSSNSAKALNNVIFC